MQNAQNHRMVCVGKDLEDHLLLSPLPWTRRPSTRPSSPDLVAQSPIQPGLVYSWNLWQMQNLWHTWDEFLKLQCSAICGYIWRPKDFSGCTTPWFQDLIWTRRLEMSPPFLTHCFCDLTWSVDSSAKATEQLSHTVFHSIITLRCFSERCLFWMNSEKSVN